jgi:hypothetical protein
MTGSLTLSEYPGEIVRLSCAKCGRAGQYRKQNLIERYGADIRLRASKSAIVCFGSTEERASDQPPFQRNAFRQRLCVVLAEDCRCPHIKTSLVGYRLRQLRYRGRHGFAGEATRPGNLCSRCSSRCAMSALQWPWTPAHHCVGGASVDLMKSSPTQPV